MSPWFSPWIDVRSMFEKNAAAAAASFLRMIERILGRRCSIAS